VELNASSRTAETNEGALTARANRIATAPAVWVWTALGLGLVLPSLVSLADFVWLAKGGGGSNLAQQLAYGCGKAVQFALPLVCFYLLERRLPRPAAPGLRGLGIGVGFGLIVAGGMLALYYFALRNNPVLAQTPMKLRQKLEEFGLSSPAGFALFAGFVCIVHSLLEEYYFRWFLFGWLVRRLAVATAIVVSSAGFMAHHVIVLWIYMPNRLFTGVVPLALCVAVGGAFWAWLYQRSGSLYACWLSHLLVDAALFVVGYDLFFVRG